MASLPWLQMQPYRFGSDVTETQAPLEEIRLSPPRLLDLFDQYPALPSRTALLGVCDDGLPVLFDLQDPRPGAVLVTGGHAAGKTHLLQTILLSTLAYNSPREVQYVALYHRADEWLPWTEGQAVSRYVLGQAPVRSREAGEWITRMAEVVEARRSGHKTGPAILVFIDGFEWIGRHEQDVRKLLEFVLQAGPAVRVWVIAAMDASFVELLPAYRSFFGTLICGWLEREEQAGWQSELQGIQPAGLERGRSMSVRVQGRWLTFDLPLLD